MSDHIAAERDTYKALLTREKLRASIAKAVFNSENHPVPHAVLGRDMSKLIDAIVEEVYTLIGGE